MENPEHFDVIFANGTVIDGSGSPRFKADVGILGDRIAAVGDLSVAKTDKRVDASSKIVAPGFIDAHTHDDRLLFADPAMKSQQSL
jgi:N-acyl-D-amino-acid deacylase